MGTHWFEWVDEPSTGRFDGKNCNIGFLDVTDRPYPELVAAAKATRRRILSVHSGKEPPVDRQAKVQYARDTLTSCARSKLGPQPPASG